MRNSEKSILPRFLNDRAVRRSSHNTHDSKHDKNLSTERLSPRCVSRYNDINNCTNKEFKRSSSYRVIECDPLHLSGTKEIKISRLERVSSCHLPGRSSQVRFNTKEDTKSKQNHSLRQPNIRSKVGQFSSQRKRKDLNRREEFVESGSSRSLRSSFRSLSCFFRKSNRNVLGKLKVDEVHPAKKNSLSAPAISQHRVDSLTEQLMSLDGINTTYKQLSDCSYETESVTTDNTNNISESTDFATSPEKMRSYGLACSDAGQHDLAIQFFEMAVRIMKREQMFQNDLDLDIANVYSFKAAAHVALKDWDAAISSCKEVVDIRLDMLREEDTRVVGALEDLCSAMEQNDVLKRIVCDSTHFDECNSDMKNLEAGIQQDIEQVWSFEEELEKDMNKHKVPLKPLSQIRHSGRYQSSSSTFSTSSEIETIFRDFHADLKNI